MIYRFETEGDWLEFRSQNITSTEVAALFGLSEYKSRLKLWHIKAKNIEDDDLSDNPFVRWGRRLQGAVGRGICEDEAWGCEDLAGFFMHDPICRVGASFDFRALSEDEGPGILETKTTGFFGEETGWDKDRAPTDNEFQIATQLHLASKFAPEIKWGRIGVLSGRKETRLYRRVHDPELGALIEEEALKFWRSIELNEPPAPDYRVDAELLAKLRGPVKPESMVNLTGNNHAMSIMQEWRGLDETLSGYKDSLGRIENRKKAIQAEIHQIMGTAEVATIGDFRVKAKEQHVDDKIVYAYSFRRFDATLTKGKRL